MQSSSINSRTFRLNRLIGCKARGKDRNKNMWRGLSELLYEISTEYFVESFHFFLPSEGNKCCVSAHFLYVTEKKVAFDAFVTVDSVASCARRHWSPKPEVFLLCHQALGYEMAPAERAEKETERKQSMAAHPVTPSRTRKTAVCPQLYEIWRFLPCLLVPKDMFIIATSLTTTLKQHFLWK